MKRKISVILLFMIVSIKTVSAGEPFVVTFRYNNIGVYYITAIYHNNSAYLPLGELCRILEIPLEHSKSDDALYGVFPENSRWEITPFGFNKPSVRLTKLFNSSDIIIEGGELYLNIYLFDTLLGLIFSMDFRELSLKLKSEFEMPVELRKQREQRRKTLSIHLADSALFPLVYPYKRDLIKFGVVDYQIGTILNCSGRNYNILTSAGGELLGGSIQGSLNFLHGERYNKLYGGDLQWRYIFPANRLITMFRLGQQRTTGLSGSTVTGWSVTNDPIMQRKNFSSRIIKGKTMPGAEVELYINRNFYDYTVTDSSGSYKFQYPLNYGATREELYIYNYAVAPIEYIREIRVPNNFVPPGKLIYNLQGGWIHSQPIKNREEGILMQGDLAYGVSNFLTLKIGTEQFAGTHQHYYYGIADLRIFNNFLVRTATIPGTMLQVTGEMTSPKNSMGRFNWLHFSDIGIYNRSGLKQFIECNLYSPVKLFGVNSGIRFNVDYQSFIDCRQSAGTRLNLYWRNSMFNAGININRRSIIQQDFTPKLQNSIVNGDLLWYLHRSFINIPSFNHLFLKFNTQYNLLADRLILLGIEVVKVFNQAAKLQFGSEYRVAAKNIGFQIALIVDLHGVRSSSVLGNRVSGFQFSQQISGSVMPDNNRYGFVASNRSQLGMAAVKVRLFIDDNNNGLCDKDEKIVECSYLRIFPGAKQSLGNDGVLRITQLQPYWEYRAEIPENIINDPTLIPNHYSFSFSAGPNQFTAIDIPLYRTGVAEGEIIVESDNEKRSVMGGIRLILKNLENNKTEILRTFSDGRFYVMNLLPGRYSVEIDPLQIKLLKADSSPEISIFEIKAVPDGDYVDDIKIKLKLKR